MIRNLNKSISYTNRRRFVTIIKFRYKFKTSSFDSEGLVNQNFKSIVSCKFTYLNERLKFYARYFVFLLNIDTFYSLLRSLRGVDIRMLYYLVFFVLKTNNKGIFTLFILIVFFFIYWLQYIMYHTNVYSREKKGEKRQERHTI